MEEFNMLSPDGSPQLTLRVSKKALVADDIYMFELRDPKGSELPVFTPGSHITVSTPSGQNRRYSLCNPASDRQRYVIAVKREADGRGGSQSLTGEVSEGDALSIGLPENDFKMSLLQPRKFIFIAGGIGITPIRSMIYHLLEAGNTNFKLYYFTRTPSAMAFREEFLRPEFDGKVVLHCDGGNPDEAYDLWPVLEEPAGAHLYCCGPKGLMSAVRDMTGHWSDSAVHFEDFVGVSATRPDDKPFRVHLAKSHMEVDVPAGVSILEALRTAGLKQPSSCESGTCGTCRTRYLRGEVEHRDLVLSDREKKSEIMICVSRALTEELVLDL